LLQRPKLLRSHAQSRLEAAVFAGAGRTLFFFLVMFMGRKGRNGSLPIMHQRRVWISGAFEDFVRPFQRTDGRFYIGCLTHQVSRIVDCFRVVIYIAGLITSQQFSLLLLHFLQLVSFVLCHLCLRSATQQRELF
jgi:hypothetical protein